MVQHYTANIKNNFRGKLLLMLFLFTGLYSYGQNCTVNAGVLNITICETDNLTLEGNTPSPIIGTVTWSQVSGPAVVITSPNSPTTTVTGYTGGNTYTFRYAATCGDGIFAYQDKVVNVLPITVANAGGNITSCPDATGSLVITGNAPQNVGETGHWEIVGGNNAGVVINFPNSNTSTITLPTGSCGTTNVQWVIEGTEYAPGQRCRTTSQITITNYGGVTPVTAGTDQTLSNCYTTTQSATLSGSYGGCGLNGQNGTWAFVSGPNTPVINSANSNSTNVSNLVQGTYVFRWTVTGPCASGTDTVSITVPAATQDVTPLPGGTETIVFCDPTINQVTLQGVTPLYAGETVQWTQVGGGSATIVSPTNPTTLITGISDAGDPYTFRYTLTNSVTGCVSTKDYVVQYSASTRTIEANNGDNLVGSCDQSSFTIPLTTTGTGSNSYRIVDGPDASPLGPFPTSFQSVGNSLSITLAVSGTYIIEFVRTEDGDLPEGCDYGFDNISVIVSNEPTPSNAGSDQNLACGVTTTTLSGVTTSDEGNNYWGQISGPNDAVISDPLSQNTTVSGLIPGSYVFQYITKGGGVTCGFSTSNVTINVSDTGLSAPDAGPNQIVCSNSEVQLSASVPQSGEYGEWTQVSGPDTITFSNVNDPNAIASGFNTPTALYELQWTIGYINPGPSCGSPVSDTVEVATNNSSAPTIANAGADICYPAGTTVISLSGNSTALLEQGTWTVIPSAGVVFADANDPNTTATVPGDGTYTFTWTIAPTFSSCTPSFDSVTITVATTPVIANAGPDQSACSNTFVMAATASSGGTGTWTRISGFGGYTISDVNDPAATFTFTLSGFYIFRWTVDADICGTAFDDVNITVGIAPAVANAGTDQDVCDATSTTLGGNAYDDFFADGQWSVLNGAPNVPVFADPTDPNTTISGLITGTYTLRWSITATNVFICPDTFDDVVINVAAPANAGQDASYCDVSSVQLVASTNSTGIWTQTSGPTSAISQSPPNSNIANATTPTAGTYVFSFQPGIVNLPGGPCSVAPDSVTIQVFSGPSVAPNAGPDQTLCITDVSGTATLAGNSAPVDVTNAHWEFVYQPSGGGAVITSPTNPTTTATNLNVQGLYILAWVFESNSCRTVSDIVRIMMYNAPSTANAGPDDTVACQQTYQTAAVAPTVGIGTWSFASPADDPSGGAVVIDNPNNPVTTLSNITTLGTYVLTWTVTNGPFTSPSTCQPSVDTVTIIFNDDPPSVADAGPDQELCNETQVTMAATPVTSGIGTWTQTAGPSTATIASPNSPTSVMFGLIAGTYEFTWTTSTVNFDGCTSTDTMEVLNYALPSTADAGPDQQVPQFSPVIMAAVTPTVGSGTWTQISGPSSVGFTAPASPTTTVTGTIAGTYVFQWNVVNGNCAALTDQVTVQILALADLELTKSVLPTSGNVGSTVTFTIAVFNNNALGGSVNATGVAVRDVIPAGYTLVPGTVSNGGVYNLGDHSITWSNLSITNGSTVSLTFNATINATGSYVNTAQVTASNQYDPDSTPNNNVSTEDDQDDASITLQSADLSVQKTVAPTSASIGDTVVFTVAVTNSGPNNATGVTVLDQLPTGYTYVSDNSGGTYNNGTGIWTIGTINNGATASIQITATVNVANTLDYQNFAEVQTSNQLDPDSTPGNGVTTEDDMDDATIVPEEADLELLKNVSQSTVVAGTTVTFTLTVVNNGPGNATGVAVADVLPNGYTIVPGTVSNGGVYQIANSTINWQNLSIVNGSSLDLTFNAVVNATGNHLNTAQVTASDLPDPDSTPNNGVTTEDDYDEIAVIVSPFAVDLSLTKTVVNNNLTPLVGSQITFEIEVTNSSTNTATGVQVLDIVPNGYQYVVFSSTQGNYNQVTGIWNVGTITPNTSEILLITVNVNASGDYTNIAEVSACDQPDTDSTPGNGVPTEDDYSDVTTTPVTQSADLSLLKSVDNATPLIGSQVIFEILIGNDGPQDATSVAVTDLLPSGYTFVSYNSSVGAYAPSSGLWFVGNLASGSIESLHIVATVNATGDYLNTAEVSASSLPDPDSTPANGVTTEDDYGEASTTPVPLEADLEIGKIVDNATPVVGSQVTFTIGVTNFGPYDVNDVNVTDLLPSGYTFVSYTATSGAYLPTTGEWLIGAVSVGALPVLSITAIVNPTGNYTNEAEITLSDVPDPDSTPANGITTEDDYDSVATTPIPASTDLSLTKTVNNATPLVGSQVTFEIIVTNNGPLNTTGVTVTDLLPTGYTFTNYTVSTGTYNSTTGIWTVGNLANGESETLQLMTTVNASGDYTNSAEITASDIADPNSTPNNGVSTEDDYVEATTTPVAQAADLSITKTVNDPTLTIGDQATFEIIVTNNGPQNTTGVVVADLLAPQFTFISYTVSTGTYNATTGLWTIGNLANGESETLQITVEVNAVGTFVNSTEVTASNLPDPDSTSGNGVTTEDDYASVSVSANTQAPIDINADLSLIKTVNNATPIVGSQVIFTLTVNNSGPFDATGVAVTDLLPPGYTYVSYTATAGTYDASTGLWFVNQLPDVTSETLQITATVNATGLYLNTAEVTASSQPDPDSTPNNGVITEDDYASAITIPTALYADLSLTKTVNNATPLVGTQVVFDVTINNTGPQDATGVSVTDLLPTGYTYVSYSTTNGNYVAASGIWTIGTLAANTSHTLQITATVNGSGNYTNIAEVVSSNIPDPDSTPNNGIITEDDYASVSTTPVPININADLAIVKTVDIATPLYGSQVTFTVGISNTGPYDTSGVSVTDLLPSGYTYVSYNTTAGTYSPSTGIWLVGSLANGAIETLQVTAIVNATGNYENIAEVTSSTQPDPDSTPGNGVTTEDDYASVIVTPTNLSADLSLSKTVNNATPLVGTQVVFDVTINNAGPQDATGVSVTDLLPTGYTYVSYSTTNGNYVAASGIWTIGTLAANTSHTLQITATVNGSGNYTNIAEVVSSNIPDPDSAPNNGITTEDDYASVATVPVQHQADLSVTKTVLSNVLSPVVGTNITFNVNVTNAGPQIATGITVTDILPSGYTYISHTSTSGTYDTATGVWTIGNLAVGITDNLQITVTVNASGNYQNIAEVTASDQSDPDSTPANGVTTEDDYASVTTTPVATAADLSLTKTVSNGTPLVGSQVIFSIQVNNSGPQATTGVTVIDLLPSGYTYVSYSTTAGTYNPATGLWNVGTIANGGSHTLQVTATVNASGIYANIAEITASSQPDPDSTPNNGAVLEDDYATAVTIPIGQSADLSLTKSVNNATPLVGSQVTFSLQVSNAGPQDTSGVTVTDLLPSGYTYVSYTATSGAYNAATGVWTVGNIVTGSFHTLQIIATVNAAGNYQNTAEVTASNLPDPDSTVNNGVTSEDDYASVTTVPVAISADLSITKTVNKPTPLVGESLVFTVVVTNNGPQTATGVQVSDLLPSGYSFIAATTTTGTYNNSTGVWQVGTVNTGVSETLLINASVLASGNYTNIAEVTTSDLPDPDSTPGNGITTEDDYASVTTIPVAVAADLSITKTVNNATPIIGNSVTFEVIITNNGPQAATGVIVTDQLPSGYSYVLASTTSGIYNSTNGQWIVGNLASGASETLLINGTVLPTGNYLNVAEVTASNQFDPDSTPGNGVTTEDDYASAITVPVSAAADLSLTKTIVGNNTTPLVGSQIIFTLTVSNVGPQTATGITITDMLPTGYTFVSYTATTGIYNDATGVWNISSALISGDSATLQITALVNATGNYLNIAEITASNLPDPDSTPNNGITTEDDYASIGTVPVVIVADLSLTKTVNNPTPLVGTGVTFEVIVTNSGPQTATGVIVTDLLPSGYSYVVASTTSGVYNNTTGEWVVGVLASGESETLLINGTVLPTGNYLNIAEVTSSDQQDPDSTPGNGITTEDDYASVTTVPIIVLADLSLTKNVSNVTPLIGSNVTFEIVVTNSGPQAATGIIVTDLLPSGYSFFVASATAGVYNSSNGQWIIGAMASGNSETLVINATVLATGNYLNVAEVTSSNQADPDSTPGNGITTEDDYASATIVPVIPTADLSLTKTIVGGNATPLVGSQIIFNIEIANAGLADATGVQVIDLLPSGYTFVSYNATAGIYNDVTGLWTLGSALLSGASSSIQITATVNGTGNYLNVAEIFASNILDPDSTPNNGVTTEDDYDSVITVPIATVADISLTKTVIGGNLSPLVGSQVSFEIVVANNGPQSASGVQVTDLLPSGYTYVIHSATAGNYNSTTGVWHIGMLFNGDSSTLIITAIINPTGNYTNIAEVSASSLPDPDSTPGNGIATEDDYGSVTLVPVATSADLSLTKTVSALAAVVGTQVTFEVVVTNNGPQNTTGVIVTDLLPSGYTFNSFTVSTGTYNTTTGLWTIGNLANGESETLQVTATMKAVGQFINEAEVTASSRPDPDSTPGNGGSVPEDDYAAVAVIPIVPMANLTLEKSVVGGNLSPIFGTTITFQVTVSNSGPQDATGVKVIDILPSGYDYVVFSSTAGNYNQLTGIWDIGTIDNGGIETLLMTVVVKSTGNYLNIAEVFASDVLDPDSIPNNNLSGEDDLDSVQVTPVLDVADLSVTKTVINDILTPLVGSEITFAITVTNSGPGAATGVVLRDILPAAYTYLSYNTTSGVYNSANGEWNAGIVLQGATETLLLHVIVNSPTGAVNEYLNETEVIAMNQHDPDSTPDNGVVTEDDYASIAVIPVIPSADLSLTKTVNNATPVVGTQVTFEIVITNDGPQDAQNVIVNDLLPDGYTYSFASATAGVYNEVTGEWNVGTVQNNSVEVLIVYAIVNENGNHVNTAQVMASSLPDPDSTPGNNVPTEDDQASASVTPVVESADLSLTKTVDNATPFEGEQVTFEVSVTNSGPQDAPGVQVGDLLPSGYVYVISSTTLGTYNPQTGIWNIGTITNGNTETLLVTATVLASGDHLNIAQVTASALPDPDSTPNNDDGDQSEDDEDSVSVQIPGTDIGITKDVNMTEPAMGSNVTFTITASNLGTIAATNVEVTDMLPSGYEFVSANATSGTYDVSSGLWTIPAIAVSSQQILTMTVKVIDNNNYLNTASLTRLDQIDSNASNNSDTAEVKPKCLMIYNEFSPNDDGDNDTFYIDCITQYPNNVLEIFSRWGDKVYSRKAYDNTWDGTSDGPEKTLPVGTYFYILDLGDGSEKQSGWLYLKR